MANSIDFFKIEIYLAKCSLIEEIQISSKAEIIIICWYSMSKKPCPLLVVLLAV